MALIAATLWLPGAAPLASLEVTVTGLRSAKGLVQLCLTAAPAHFPDCAGDPAGRHLVVPAATAMPLRFDGLPAGRYAIALFHDENGNGRLDTRFGMPTEGFGFSNNPRISFGPPRFAAARFTIGGASVAETVRVRYLF